MIVRIGCTYSYDMDFNDYEFEQRLRTMGGDFLPQRHRGAELGGCDFPAESQRRRGDGGHFLLFFGVGQKYLRKDALNELLCRFARCMVRW